MACNSSEPADNWLPDKPDIWVSKIASDEDSVMTFVEKTDDYLITETSSVRNITSIRSLSVGDEIEGIEIGAIRCTFHNRNESWAGEQFMWKGRWTCMASRNQQEILNAVGKDGFKHFSYIHLSPVSMHDSK
jgi:hypothetical protein